MKARRVTPISNLKNHSRYMHINMSWSQNILSGIGYQLMIAIIRLSSRSDQQINYKK